MVIGIDGSRAFLAQRTGIEEYSYQVIKHLGQKLEGHEVVLYIKKNQTIDFELPKNWQIRMIKLKYFWTQVGLSWEMFWHPVDVLFVPAHTVPIIHPENTVVTIHGLEYEFLPEAYSRRARFYMRSTIKKSCQWAKKIIAVSRNTKKDLADLYKVPEEKIQVVYEGYDREFAATGSDVRDFGLQKPFLFFVGRLEERKNIIGQIKTFEILKEKYHIPHQLVLAGRPGFGYEKIFAYLSGSAYKNDIVELGFVSDAEKWQLMAQADVFLFPTFYEGFGIPVLEAQGTGVPVVCSNLSSLEEVCDLSAILVDPNEPAFIAERINVLIGDKQYRDELVKKGYENIKRFSWEKCATEIAEILVRE